MLKAKLALGIALGVVSSLGLSPAYAQDASHDHAAMQAAAGTGYPYLLKTDPVSGDPLGDKPIVYQYEGRELRFTDQKTLDAFKADPGKYLPKVDQQMIQQQLPGYPLTTCMVSGDKLGGDMGKAVDIIYKNRLVRFCCPDCLPDFKKDPAKYLKLLDEAAAKKAAESKPAAGAAKNADHGDHAGH